MQTKAYSMATAAADKQGFTLVELMVAMLMAVIFIAATITIVGQSSRTYRSQERVSDTQQDVRAALDMLVRDMRMAGYNPKLDVEAPAAGIIAATATTFEYTADLDNSGAIEAGQQEDVLYTYDPDQHTLTLTRDVTADPDGTHPVEPIIDKVQNFQFTYLDADGDATTDPTQMVRFQITIACQDKKGTFVRTLAADFNFRNRRFM
jgi:type IV pilus assembly protein PilW